MRKKRSRESLPDTNLVAPLAKELTVREPLSVNIAIKMTKAVQETNSTTRKESLARLEGEYGKYFEEMPKQKRKKEEKAKDIEEARLKKERKELQELGKKAKRNASSILTAQQQAQAVPAPAV